MSGPRFQDIWKEQCEAARDVRERHGVAEALHYLIGEKLLGYAETAEGRPEFARELPQFVAEVRRIFTTEELRAFFEVLEENVSENNVGAEAKLLEESGLLDSPEQTRVRVEKLGRLKPLLLTEVLGTG